MDSPDNRKRLYAIMLQTMLIVPIPEVPAGLKPGFNTTEGNTQLQLVFLTDRQGRRVTPC